MSEFWELWNRAEAGDTEAAQQVNVLVAKRVGWKSRMVERPMYSKTTGELVRALNQWYLEAPNGRTANIHSHSEESELWSYLPDYMSDLNAAAGLVLPCYQFFELISAYTDGKEYAPDDCWICSVFHGTEKVCRISSLSEARARVGAWWAAVTGEAKPE